MKARTDLFGRCAGCGRRLKRKSKTCSRLCSELANTTSKSMQRAPLIAAARQNNRVREWMQKPEFTPLNQLHHSHQCAEEAQ